MITIVKSGKGMLCVHLGRTHRVCCAFIAEGVDNLDCLTGRVTKIVDQAADIHTKRLSDPREWFHALTLKNPVY
eukprot:12903111-Prorocentrum_lima.AAC.1